MLYWLVAAGGGGAAALVTYYLLSPVFSSYITAGDIGTDSWKLQIEIDFLLPIVVLRNPDIFTRHPEISLFCVAQRRLNGWHWTLYNIRIGYTINIKVHCSSLSCFNWRRKYIIDLYAWVCFELALRFSCSLITRLCCQPKIYAVQFISDFKQYSAEEEPADRTEWREEIMEWQSAVTRGRSCNEWQSNRVSRHQHSAVTDMIRLCLHTFRKL